MRILHINEKFASGGAGLAARRLGRGQAARGHEVSFLAAPHAAGDADRLPAPAWPEKIRFHAFNLAGLNSAGLDGVERLLELPAFTAADIVHLHNLHGGYFNYRWLPALARKKPLAWTWHDMWPMTGHCAHAFECRRWMGGCGRCPHPDTYPAVRMDNTRVEWRWKAEAIRAARPWVSCPSAWLAGLAKGRFPELRIEQIDNALGAAFVFPERAAARQALGLPLDAVVLVFSADRLGNPFKNHSLLLEALRRLSRADAPALRVVGVGEPAGFPREAGDHALHFTGYLHEEATAAQWLAAADIFAQPSRAENQPLAVIEAMAAGCAVLATPVGGLPELLDDGAAGLLAPPDAEAWAQALTRLVREPETRAALGAVARKRAAERHGMSACLDAHDRWYERILNSWWPA